MPEEIHSFLGATDTDSPDHVIQRGFHKEARNVIFRGGKGSKRLENLVGTTSHINPFLPNTGVNKTIGSFYDSVNYRIIEMNYSSVGQSGIYVFNTIPKTWQVLIQIGNGSTDGDILGFTPDLIDSVNILYNEQVDGNLLFFVDTLGRPTCFNIERYLNTPYSLIKRAYIDVAKAPPQMPPKCVYENDNVGYVTINNIKNGLFQFKERFVYDDFQKSVYSSGSEVPLPVSPTDPLLNNKTYVNSRISVWVSTGDSNVKKIEIWGRQATDTTSVVNNNAAASPDYFLIASLDKAKLSIPDNSIYRFLFYNDGVYTFGSIEEETQLFDYVPQVAGCQDLLNGNVPVYGDITEGYDNIQTDILLASDDLRTPPYSNMNGLLFFATSNGLSSGGQSNIIRIYLTGWDFSFNNSNNNPTEVTFGFVNYNVIVKTISGVDLSFSFADSDGYIPTTLPAIAAAAVSKGFTLLTSPDYADNSITLSYPSPIIVYSSSAVNTGAPDTLYETYFAYAHNSAYDFAIAYYDDKGRTNGAQLSTNNPITTPEDLTGVTIPEIKITIRHRPPLWAKYWQLLRSNSLTYNKRLEWVSNQTFTNQDLNTDTKYAYIGISNFSEYNSNIEAATPVVSYQFTQGDRIRFCVRYPVGAAASTLTTGLDYEIVSTEDNPIINGIIQKGTFIKIFYPQGDISGNFDFGGDAFQNYKILIYNYVKRSSTDTTIYYEFGKQYAIGNAGTSTAFHMAEVQTQLPDLSQPAITNTIAGDYFYRNRIVPAGMIYYIAVTSNPYVDFVNTFGITVDNSPVNTAAYTLQNQSAAPYGISPVPYQNKLSIPQRIRITGSFTLQVGASHTATVDIVGIFRPNGGPDLPGIVSNFQYLYHSFYLGQGENITTYPITVDGFISVPSLNGLFICLVNNNGATSSVRNGAFTLRFEIINNITIPVVESSFSDKYSIITNSNSRPLIYDSNAKLTTYPTRYRWGLADIINTNINNTNRFYFQDYDEVDLSHGPIVRLRARQKEMRVFQQRRCGRIGVYNKFIRDNSGQNVLTSTDTIITQNNIQYYEGEFGIGNQGSSLVSSGYADYFIDPVRGCILSLSLDGLINISELYRVQTWAGANLPTFLNSSAYQFGGNNAIIGCFNFTKDREGEAIFVLQGKESFAFNEQENAWTSFYDFVPDQIVCAENVLYSFFNGVLYSHDNTTTYCKFYGTQYKPSITLTYNEKVESKKTWISISQPSNVQWNSPLIYTEMFSYGIQRQESNLVDTDFKLLESEYNASFLKDIHSIGGIGNGSSLKGGFMVIKLTVTDGSQFIYLMAPAVKYIDSPLNSR